MNHAVLAPDTRVLYSPQNCRWRLFWALTAGSLDTVETLAGALHAAPPTGNDESGTGHVINPTSPALSHASGGRVCRFAYVLASRVHRLLTGFATGCWITRPVDAQRSVGNRGQR